MNNNFFQNFFLQTPDLSSVREIWNSHWKAWTNANQLAFEFAQSTARRNVEIFQKHSHKAYETGSEALSCQSPEDLHRLQTGFASEVYEGACENAKELIQAGSKTAFEIMESFKVMTQCQQHQSCQTPKKAAAK